ncbi:MAG: hypothetical protein AB1480_07165 [Nitrospirota bacterium]
MAQILWLLGIGLLILGALSGAALFFRAVTAKDKATEETGRGTLWGLFILCTIGGIILLSIGYSGR